MSNKISGFDLFTRIFNVILVLFFVVMALIQAHHNEYILAIYDLIWAIFFKLSNMSYTLSDLKKKP